MGKNQDLKRLALQSIVFSIDAVMKRIEDCCKPLPVIKTDYDRIPNLETTTSMTVDNVTVENDNESVVQLASAIQVLAAAYVNIERGSDHGKM